MANWLDTGRKGERRAKKLLEQKGYTIIEHNFRTRFGEIDLIARRGDEVIFVEVKTRTSSMFGHPEESITKSKLEHLHKAAHIYLNTLPHNIVPRFDVIAITWENGEEDIHHIENISLQ